MPDLIIELLEDSGLLIDGASETVKYEIKTQEGGFLSAVIAPMTALMIVSVTYSFKQPVAFSLINAISGKGVMRAGKR